MNQYEAVIEELRQQEEEIQFTSFTNDTALAIGMALLQEARKRSNPVVIDITRSGQQQQEDHELVVTTLKQFLASSAN